MADVGMAAFSVFFMQSPSCLAHQRHLAQGRSHCESLFGMTAIPCDNPIRALLDPVSPVQFEPMFDDALAVLERAGGVPPPRRARVDRARRHRVFPLGHAAWLAMLDPGARRRQARVFPCRAGGHAGRSRPQPGGPPAFIVPQDGHDKQDCERRAARRWLERHGARYARLDPIYLGDDLYAGQPMCETLKAIGGHFLFVCKPGSPPTLTEHLTGVELFEHRKTVKRERFSYRYRWLSDMPLRDTADAMSVNWLSIEIADPKGRVTYRNSFVTDLAVDRDTVASRAAAGRARWKIENESFNTLKTKGYNLEHNFGHGRENLAAVLATLNLLAFAFHTVCELTEALWRTAMQAQGRRTRFFEHLRSITVFLLFPSWRHLLQTLAFVRAPPLPP